MRRDKKRYEEYELFYKNTQAKIDELKKEFEYYKLSASIAKGKEVIKAEISKELIEAKEIFANFQISETTQEEIKSKISKHVDRVENIWSGENYFVNTLSIIPIVGNITGPIHAAEHSRNLEKRIKEEVKEKLPEVVNKLIATATKDLEKKKKNVLKKMDELMKAREKEVTEAKKVIDAWEIVNRERENEIEGLQEGIRELNKQLREYREKEKDAQNFLKKQREAERKRTMEADNNVNRPIQDNQEKIKRLQDYINTLELSLKVAEDSRDQRVLELEHKQNELDRKNDELARKMKIANDLQQQLNQEIRDWEAKHQKVSDEKHELDLENTDLKAENKKYKDKYNKAKNEAEEWKTKWEGLQPTWIQKKLSDLGITQFKNTIATSCSIAGAFVVLYAISWMWKNVIKETWKNFKGEPEEEARPRKKEKVRYEDYEEISEPKEKPQSLPEKQPTIIINNSTPAEKEANQSPVISKEPVKQEEILTKISDEKTDPISEEKTESEKPVKKGKQKKKKNKKKVKGESD